MATTFERVRDVVVKQLKVSPDEVKPEASLVDDLRADSLDIVDLTIAIEEAFADDAEFEIRDEDVKMDVFRASGAGGQHVNKTSSAVRLTHVPSGIIVTCQQERSQGKNKATAMKQLKNRLYQLEVEKQAAVKAKLDANKADVTFGSQIRSYVFQPYTMVNDHRTELKITDVQKVMDGAIDPFIEAYLKMTGAGHSNGAKS